MCVADTFVTSSARLSLLFSGGEQSIMAVLSEHKYLFF